MTPSGTRRIRLAKRAPWATPAECNGNPALRNTYRARFAYVEGRRFKVSAEYLNAPWWVEEVDEHGEALVLSVDYNRAPDKVFEFGFGKWAMTLAEARALIAEEVGS